MGMRSGNGAAEMRLGNGTTGMKLGNDENDAGNARICASKVVEIIVSIVIEFPVERGGKVC